MAEASSDGTLADAVCEEQTGPRRRMATRVPVQAAPPPHVAGWVP